MKEIKYGKTTVLATGVLLRKVRENLARLEEINWDSDKSEQENLLTSHEDFFKLTELSDNLLSLIDIDGSFVDEITRDGGDISVNIYDHSGDDEGLSPQLFTTGMYTDTELSNDWMAWYRDTKETNNEEE